VDGEWGTGELGSSVVDFNSTVHMLTPYGLLVI